MPGIGEEMEGAVQQAPQSGRHNSSGIRLGTLKNRSVARLSGILPAVCMQRSITSRKYAISHIAGVAGAAGTAEIPYGVRPNRNAVAPCSFGRMRFFLFARQSRQNEY
jgi:hypothetical protein